MANGRNITDLYNWRENRFTALSHELRVYIYGEDVSDWLRGDLSVTYGNRDSFNTAAFELANPKKIWQLTRPNLEGTFLTGSHEYAENAKLGIYIAKNTKKINPFFELNITKQILGQQGEEEISSYADVQKSGSKKFNAPKPDQERRWRMAVNDCIFGRNDPVRIFMRNPYKSRSDTGAGEWVEVFCGFIQDHPITTNYATGESFCRINCVCVRQMLTKMRVQLNRLGDTAIDPQPLFDKGFFADFRDPSQATFPFANTALEAAIKELILGTPTPTKGQPAERSGGERRGGGIGDFMLGNTICYNPENSGNTLERWHLMTLFGVNKVPFPNGPDDDLWLTTLEMESIGKSTIYWPDVYAQGPSGRYLHFLLPDGGTGAGSLIQATHDASPPKGIEWTTRWDVIRDFAKNLDFQVLTSPSGDLLVEFPMYSFTPHILSPSGDTSSFPNSVSTAKGKPTATELMQKAISDGKEPLGLGKFLTFEHHQMEDTLNDESEDFPTVLQIDGGMANQLAPQAEKTQELAQLRAFVYCPVLVSRFGVISEQMSIPFAGQKGDDMDKGPNSVMANRLKKLGLIEYMKRLADASSWDGSVAFRPFLFPNRPVWLKKSHRIGNLTSVTNRWSIGKSASSSFSLNMLMAERYDPESKKFEYRLPTGAANAPISYASLWTDDVAGDQNSSVHSESGTTAPPANTTPANGSQGSVGSGKVSPTPPRISLDDETYMFPEFATIIKDALGKWGESPAISITSTYRSPEFQADMKERQLAGDPKYAKFAVGEPWRSTHQYGIAVDIKIAGGAYADYKNFYALCEKIAPGNIYWGDTYKRNGGGDYIHFEYKPSSYSTGIGGKADELRRKAGITNMAGTEHLKLIWAFLRNADSKPSTMPPYAAPSTEQQKLITEANQPVPRQISTGVEEPAGAGPCRVDYLDVAGIKKIEGAGT